MTNSNYQPSGWNYSLSNFHNSPSGQFSKFIVQSLIVNYQMSILNCQLSYSRVMPFLCDPSDPSAYELGVRRVRRVTSFLVKPLYTRAYIQQLNTVFILHFLHLQHPFPFSVTFRDVTTNKEQVLQVLEVWLLFWLSYYNNARNFIICNNTLVFFNYSAVKWSRL